MSQVAGSLEIQIFAGMARLQKDMDQAKRIVGNAADVMTKALGAIGVGVSLAGITSMIKSVVDVGDHLNDLRKITGLTVNELGGLDKQAKLNGTNLDSVAKAIGIMSKNMYTGVDAFKLLGIATKDADGNLRNANQVLLDVADRFSRMQDGAQKSAIANQIFGKSGRELIPLLNEGRGALESAAEAHRKYSGVTQASAEASDVFNDNLTLLGGRVTAIKTSFVGELLPTLNAISTAMLNSGQSTNQFSFAANIVVPVLKGLAIAGAAVVGIFQGVGREIGAAAAQMAAIARFDFNGVAAISKALAEDHKKADAAFDKYVKTILNSDNAVQQANVSQQKMIDLQVQIPDVTGAATKAIEKQTKAYDIEIYKLKQHEDLYKRGRDLTDSVATEQERYNKKIKEYNELKPVITAETYNRALEKAQKELKGTEVQTRQTTDEVSQLWMQAGRNIQSTLANSIFNFFDDGLKGMLRNVISTVGRIASEFAALKIAQGVGLAGMFGSGAASAGGIGGTGTALNLASMGSSAIGLLKSGFGATSAFSSVGGMLPGSAGAFFGGMGGGAIPGVSSQAALMGSSFASVAGPAIALFAADALTKAFAGDKTISNNGVWKAVSSVPIIGVLPNIINGLFGRGPMKQQGTSLTGEIGAEGFESGTLQTRFKANGGLFRSDKIDFARVDAVSGAIWTDNNKLMDFANDLSSVGKELFGLINDTTKQTSSSLRQIGDDLGISTAGIDKFSYSINLLTEKGEALTEEQIGQEIEKITSGLARSLLPQIDDLAKRGETALQTVGRLGAEFAVLSDAVTILGKSVAESRAFIAGVSFESRTGFVDAAGGIDALNQKAAFFAQNFMTSAERLAPAQETLNEQLTKLGLSTSLSKDQFKDLVQSFGEVNGITEETLQSLLNLQGGFLLVRNGTESMLSDLRATAKERIESAKADKIASAESAFAALQRSVDAERTRITDEYNAAVKISDERIKSVTESVNNLTQFSNTLKSTIASISPMSLLSARAIASSAIQTGNIDPSSLSNVVSILGGSLDPSKFKDRNALMRGQGQNAGLLSGLNSETDAQLLLAQRSLDALEASRQLLDDGFQSQMTGLDNILINAQEQLDSLKGIDKSIMSLSDAIQQMNSASQGGGGGSGGNGFVGSSDVTAQEIKDYFTAPRTAIEIAMDAARHNLSSAEIAAAAGFDQATVDNYFATNPDIPKFASGASFVPKTGLAVVHKGERIINADQNKDIVDSLKSLIAKVEAGTVASSDLYNLLRDSMQETSTGLAITTKAAA